MYLAINPAAKVSLSASEFEAAFIDPANWMWNDGSVGLANHPIYTETSEHDIRECWMVPQSNPDADWVIIYDADFGSADGGKALGYFSVKPPAPIPLSDTAIVVAIALMMLTLFFVYRKKTA